MATATEKVHMGPSSDREPLLEVSGLKMHFPITAGLLRRQVGAVKAVDGVELTIGKGEILGLVGESGCGKSTIARCLMREYEPTAGSILFHGGEEGSDPVDLATVPRRGLKDIWREVQMIFQDPFSSLNPRMTLRQIIAEPLINFGIASRSEIDDRVAELMRTVGLRPEYMVRYPHAFSGGQRQRIVVARALAPEPKLIICDEPVSALDVSIQAQVLNLLMDLQENFGLSYLFISHDLSVVEHLCDRIAVMYVGRLVEFTDNERLFSRPLHPYTEALLSAVPFPDPRRRKDRVILRGEVPDPANPPPGCHFAERCRYSEDRCRTEVPELREVEPGHLAHCHFAEELDLEGVR